MKATLGSCGDSLEPATGELGRTWRSDATRPAIVIATRNRAKELAGTLRRLRRLEDVGDIVVVDNASTDGTWEWLGTQFPHVIALRLGSNLGGAARTVGAMATDAPYVAFADDDSWWERDSLSRAAQLLHDYPRLAVVAGSLTVHPGGRPDPLNDVMAMGLPREPDLPGIPVLGFIACAVVVRRSAFLAAGGFDPRWGIGGEEGPLALDLAATGWGLAYVASIEAVHQPSANRDGYARRRRIARNDAWCAWTRFSTKGAIHRTGKLLWPGIKDPAVREGLVEAVRGARGILRDRRPIPAELEDLVARVGQNGRNGKASHGPSEGIARG